MIDQYLRAKKAGGRYVGKPASERTIKAYRNALQTAQRLVGKPIELFSVADGDELVYRFEEENLGPAYRANILAAVRGFFDWMMACDFYTGTHPMYGIATPKVSRELPTILSKDQVFSLFDHIHHPKYKLFFKLMYFGGLRIGEVTELQRQDIQQEGIIVRGKGNKQRFVYLPLAIMNELAEYTSVYQGSSYIFYAESANACTDQPLSLVHARETFQAAKERAGLPQGLHPHNLRHTSATHFHEHVGDLAATQKFLGHARPETTMLYAQLADKKMKDASRAVFG